MNIQDASLFVLLSFLYGSSFWLIRLAEQVVPPITVASLRLLIGAMVLHIVVLSRQNLRESGSRGWHGVRVILLLSLFNNVLPITLISLSQEEVNPGISAIILSTTPMFTLLFSRMFQGHPINMQQALGVLAGFSGVVLLSYRSAENSNQGHNAGMAPYLCLLLSATCYGLANIFSFRLVGGLELPTIVVAARQVLCAAVLTAACSLRIEFANPPSGYAHHFHFFENMTSTTWMALLGLGIGSQAAVSIIFFHLIQAIGPVRMSSAGYLVALVGFVEGVLFTDEWVGVPAEYKVMESLGGLVVLSGVWLASPAAANETPGNDPKLMAGPLKNDGARALLED